MYVSREPELAELAIGDQPEAWQALDFHVDDGNLDLGGIRIRLGDEEREGTGILSWSLRGVNADAFRRAGMPLKRTREAGEMRQGFRRMGAAIVELVYSPQVNGSDTHFWGLTVVVISLEDLSQRLGDRLGEIRPAVQPGRRIATLQPTDGVSPRLAFMSPEPP